MTLLELVTNLQSFDPEHRVFAAEPWSLTSPAIVAPAPENGNISRGLNDHAYFLEVGIAQEVLEDWAAAQETDQSPEAKCRRLISYATYDA